MSFYINKDIIYKANDKVCLSTNIPYKLLNISTNNYEIVNSNQLSIYNNINKIYTTAGPSGGTYTTASADSWVLPDKLYGYHVWNCNAANDGQGRPIDWYYKGTGKIALSTGDTWRDFNDYCDNSKLEENKEQMIDIQTSFKDMPHKSKGIVRVPIDPYILFNNMNELEHKASTSNATDVLNTYVDIIAYIVSNKIYCIIDAFHSDDYNLCSINLSSEVKDQTLLHRGLTINSDDPPYIENTLKKITPSNKYQPCSGNQFANAWKIISILLKERCDKDYIKYLIMELCNEPNGQWDQGYPEDIGEERQRYCNNIIRCKSDKDPSDPCVDEDAYREEVCTNCQKEYDIQYQIPAIKAIRSVFNKNIPIMVTIYNNWSGSPSTVRDADIVLKQLTNDLFSHNLIGHRNNNIILAVHKYCDQNNSGDGRKGCYVGPGPLGYRKQTVKNTYKTYNNHLNKYHMKWFMSEGNFFIETDDNHKECYLYWLKSMINNSPSFLGYTLYQTINWYNENIFRLDSIFIYKDNKISSFGNFKDLTTDVLYDMCTT